MSDEPQKPPQEQGVAGHLTIQAVGGAVGYLFFRYMEAAHHWTLKAGDESFSGTLFGALFFGFWWLFGPRIKRWRNRR